MTVCLLRALTVCKDVGPFDGLREGVSSWSETVDSELTIQSI